MPLHVVFLSDVNVLLAQPPQTKVGRLTGFIGPVHPWAEHCPVVRYHCCEHARHTHQQNNNGNLYLGTLVHVSSRCDFWSVKKIVRLNILQSEHTDLKPRDFFPQ
ncbi:hypothetical protein XENOCAPTIV_005575 [Xenoophorus captivus]|uniref:Uncharacterized protein n=1 Tax=Xenoophorus captivus TaxID=1517983 RepID=A0ABV0R765_9TELE